jgi:hypothetical protein
MKKKTILFLVLVLLFLVLLTNGLQGEEKEPMTMRETKAFITGDNYLKFTEDSKMNYVGGLIDMLYMQTHIYNPELYFKLEEITKNMTGLQIKAIFDKYLEENPEGWYYSAAGLFWTAMDEIINKK